MQKGRGKKGNKRKKGSRGRDTQERKGQRKDTKGVCGYRQLNWGISAPLPFETEAKHAFTDLSCNSGSTHPCPSMVHMEPLPTADLKALIRICATAAEICSNSSSTQRHTEASSQTIEPSTHFFQHVQDSGWVSHTLKCHPFSGLFHSASELLHTPWRISTSMTAVLLRK